MTRKGTPVPDRLEDALTAAEETVNAAVSDALTEVAAEYAAALNGATELVAARFSVSRITRMWGARVPVILRRLLGVAETAANRTAEDVDTPLPNGWDDLPGRHEDGRDLPPSLRDYVSTTEHLLRAVGDRLAETAVRELAAGLNAGEDVDQLRARLREAFTRDGAQLGEGREERIARTEAARAWNTAALAAARDLTGPDRPLVKQWLTRRDTRVRDAHARANGQLRLLDEPFTIAGVSMAAPGDPTAPPELVINCRCVLKMARADRTAAFESKGPSRAATADLRETGMDPSTLTVTAAGGEHTGAMLALLPRAEDAHRLTLNTPEAEPADQLRLTLFYLGDGADWDAEHRADLITRIQERTAELTPISARAFGSAHWNANSEDPCWVWSISDNPDSDGPGLNAARTAATSALDDMERQPDLPAQYSPWQPHVCAAYSSSPALLTELEDRLGEVTFDRLRIDYAGEYTDIPLGPPETPMDDTAAALTAALPSRRWSTPGDTCIAFENQETGDGRVFAPGSLYWEGGPWPLQYADEMLMGHEGAELAGAIETMNRAGDRIAANGVLYLGRPAGADAVMLLEEGAPLGISVDLDDVDVEFIDRTMPDGEEDSTEHLALAASLAAVSLLRLDDGSLILTANTAPEWTASGMAMSRSRHAVQLITGPGGTVSANAVRTAFAGTGALTAAAGDADNPEAGVVMHRERSGDLLLRVTRARVRGATLVAMPAYDRSRIVLDDAPDGEKETGEPEPALSASAPGPDHHRVVSYVSASPAPVGAREVAQALGMTMESARGHLLRATDAGRIVRLARGQYVGASSLPEGVEVTASVSGDTSLPVHGNRDAEWDGDQAASRVLEWATGDGDAVDADRLSSAFLYRDPDADPATLSAYKLGYADVIDGELRIIARGVFAIGAVLQGARGGVDVPEGERGALLDRAEDLYERLADAFEDPTIRAPWVDDEDFGDLEASAWTAMRDAPAMPAAWFKEPTAEELPPGSGGVHYSGGRIYGWVAPAGEPHAGFPGRNLTVESLGDLDLTHFLRARFKLDDGSLVRAGAFTMNVGHHRDGAECETDACQFDDSRTVAGIVTVGMSSGGLWFSGAAAPWLSEWDRSVFTACQPSYHMKQGPAGRWQLRAVLSVPVPGHSSPLIATAVAERANLALAASASGLLTSPDTMPGQDTDTSGQPESGQAPDTSGRPGDVSALTAALTDPAFLDGLLSALERRETERTEAARAELERLSAAVAPAREVITASAAGGTTTRDGDA